MRTRRPLRPRHRTRGPPSRRCRPLGRIGSPSTFLLSKPGRRLPYRSMSHSWVALRASKLVGSEPRQPCGTVSRLTASPSWRPATTARLYSGSATFTLDCATVERRRSSPSIRSFLSRISPCRAPLPKWTLTSSFPISPLSCGASTLASPPRAAVLGPTWPRPTWLPEESSMSRWRSRRMTLSRRLPLRRSCRGRRHGSSHTPVWE